MPADNEARQSLESGLTFSSCAAYYDALADAPKRMEREGPFLLRRLRNTPGTDVVDLACGTGIHAAFFADNGARAVNAFDLSPDMIDLASTRRPRPNLSYAVGDMRSLHGGPWHMAVCLGNSLSLVTDINDLHRVFHGVADVLVPGGCFVVQTLNYASSAAMKPRHRIEHARVDDTSIVAIKSLVPDGNRTFLAMHFFVECQGAIRIVPDGAVLCHWSYEDLHACSDAMGFVLSGTWGGYDESPYDPNSSTDLIMAFTRT